MRRTKIKEPRCPNCGTKYSGVTDLLGDRVPKVGDIIICYK